MGGRCNFSSFWPLTHLRQWEFSIYTDPHTRERKRKSLEKLACWYFHIKEISNNAQIRKGLWFVEHCRRYSAYQSYKVQRVSVLFRNKLGLVYLKLILCYVTGLDLLLAMRMIEFPKQRPHVISQITIII